MSRPYIPKRFLGAFKAGHRSSAREFIDEEFAYKLLKRILNSNYSDNEAIQALDYLTKFNNEYHKAVIKKGDRDALHNTDEMYQDRSHANNARNRDIMSVMRQRIESLTPAPIENRSGGLLSVVVPIYHQENRNHEDVLVWLIDAKNKIAN